MCNNNDKPWKSSKNLRVKPKSLEIIQRFRISIFCVSMISRCFSFYILFSFSCFFFFFHFSFSCFSKCCLSFHVILSFSLFFVFGFVFFLLDCFSSCLLFFCFSFIPFLLLSSSLFFHFSVDRADAKTGKTSSRSSGCKIFSSVNIRPLGFGGQR